MKRRVFYLLSLITVLVFPVGAERINWVDFNVPYESLQYAMEVDIATAENEHHIDWVDIIALAGTRTGGKCPIASVKKAVTDLKKGASPEELLGGQYKYYTYYHNAYEGILGGLLGNYAICVNGKWEAKYGLKAYCPIAAGYGYRHCSDFGNSRSFGFARKHLGHDMMGSLGTPIVAVESGVIEVMGWNRYGGWRIGIRSTDGKRYYYYAHLQKDKPFAEGLEPGDLVTAGDVIGFMGRSGYSNKENTNNIETVHLHFGMQLVFEEDQKECSSEIWIDTYNIVRLLNQHRSNVVKQGTNWVREYPLVELDINEFP